MAFGTEDPTAGPKAHHHALGRSRVGDQTGDGGPSWMTGRPVFAESARENVLFPAPAMPVTTTRRPTELAGGISFMQIESP